MTAPPTTPTKPEVRAPAFQFYVADFLSGTIHMSDAEVGHYIRLLGQQWLNGALPNDDDELLSFSNPRPNPSLTRVKAKFKVCEDGFLRNERMEAERAKQIAFRERQTVNGSLGGRREKPKHNPKEPKPNPDLTQTQPKPTPDPSSSVFSLHTSVGEGDPPPVEEAGKGTETPPPPPIVPPNPPVQTPKPLTVAEQIAIERKLEILNKRLKILKEDTSEQWQINENPGLIVEKKALRQKIADLENRLLSV